MAKSERRFFVAIVYTRTKIQKWWVVFARKCRKVLKLPILAARGSGSVSAVGRWIMGILCPWNGWGLPLNLSSLAFRVGSWAEAFTRK